MMTVEAIRGRLFALRDEPYGDFTARLTPTYVRENIIGVRLPELRKLAKELYKAGEHQDFLDALPHRYLEEYHLHSYLISLEKDYDTALKETDRLLPYIDNWGVCDSLSPKAFQKDPERVLPEIRRWTQSEHPYTVRFGVMCLMRYFLNEHFDPAYPEIVRGIVSDHYYVNMMRAWYFATALAKQYDAVLPYIEEHRLDDFTHRKSISKAVESYRVSEEHKAYLKTFR